MKKVLLGSVLCLLSLSSSALEVAVVKVPEKIQSGGQSLVLNGAGSRLMVGMFHVYAISLYLPEKKHTVAEVLAEEKSKNVTLTFLFGVTSKDLLDATHKLMAENLSADEYKKLDVSWKKFAAIFDNIKDFNKEDQLSLDYAPAKGTRVSMNGKEIGHVAEAEFMRAFLMVWLGDNPAQVDLKDKLLGLPADAKR